MSVVVNTGFTGTAQPLKHGRVCWNAYGGTATATTSAEGFAATNAATVRTDSAWRPTAIPATWTLAFGATRTVSYIGIAKHNLGTLNASITIQRQIGGGWGNFPGALVIEPADDSPILFLVPATDCEGVRVNVTAADGNPTISVIRAGLADEWPRPFVWTGQPITEGDRITFDNTQSLTGNWLGRSTASDGLQFDLTMNNAPESWRQGAFKAFKRYANGEEATFFVAARPLDYPEEVAYAWATDVVTASREIGNKRVSTSVTLSCQGLRPADG